MCFNEESSLSTFLGVLCCSIFLYKRNYKYDQTIAIIFFTVSLMQLAEFFMWKDLKCGKMNHYASKFAFIILCLEPVMITYTIYKFNVSKIQKQYLKQIFHFYLLFFGYFIVKSLFYDKQLCSLPSKQKKHLIWDHDNLFATFPKYLIYLFWIFYYMSGLLFLSFENIKVGILYLSLMCVSIGISKYFTRNNKNSSTWKSIWCIIINIIPILSIIIGEYFHKKK